jgi:hypothetical protein
LWEFCCRNRLKKFPFEHSNDIIIFHLNPCPWGWLFYFSAFALHRKALFLSSHSSIAKENAARKTAPETLL